MAYEKECDTILKVLTQRYENYQGGTLDQLDFTQPELHQHLTNNNILNITLGQFIMATAILFANKHIDTRGTAQKVHITEAGLVFIHTLGYVRQKENWELERQLKVQTATLNALEIFLKKKTFYIAVIGLLLSIISIVIAIRKD